MTHPGNKHKAHAERYLARAGYAAGGMPGAPDPHVGAMKGRRDFATKDSSGMRARSAPKPMPASADPDSAAKSSERNNEPPRDDGMPPAPERRGGRIRKR